MRKPQTNMTFRQYIIFICLLFFNRCSSSFVENDIFYQAPYLNIKFTNITFGISVPLSKVRSSFSYQSNVGGVIAAVCQADQLNQNLYKPINFTGKINLAIQDHNFDDQMGQFATLELQKNDLYYRKTGKSLSNDNIGNFGGYIGLTSSGINRINSGISAGFAMPFLNPGTLDQLDPADNFAIYSAIENRTFFSVRDTIIYSDVNAIVNLMQAFNWTLAANIYENNVLGQTGQQSIQIFQAKYSTPIFACNSILTNYIFTDTNYYVNFCKCVNGINSLKVVNLFTSAPVGYQVILQLKKNCKAASKFVFIISGESQPLPSQIYKNEVEFKSTFIIRPFGSWNFTSFLENCLETGTPQALKTVNHLLNDMLLNNFNCYKYAENVKDLPKCDFDIYNRPVPCICTGLELDPMYNPYSSQNFFFADSVSTYANVLALLQQNCTLINESLYNRNDKLVSNIDLCKLKNITPSILTGLLVLTNFTGYTGPVNFIPALLNVRAVKTFYLYNVHTTIEHAVYVGNFSIDGYYVDYSKIFLPNGNQTVSALVPQNPDLSYAVIDVFFGILIFLIFLTILAFVIIVTLRDHIVIRRNTPAISLVVLVGLLMVELSGIFTCLGVYDWTCITYIFFFNIGMALILGGIISKEFRIYIIFSNKSAAAIEFKDYKLFLIIAGLTLFYAILAVVIVFTGFGAQLVQSSSNSFYLFYRCSFTSNFKNIFFTILDEVSYFICRIFAVYLAWLTRKVASTFSESRSVFVVVTVYVCLDLIFAPLVQTLEDGTNSAIIRLTIRLINVSFTSAVTLIFMYYYRFWLVYLHEKEKKRRASNRFSALSVDNNYISFI